MYTGSMTDAPERQKRNRKPVFPIPVSMYENPEGVSLIDQLAKDRGLTVSAYLRQLVREDAARKGVKPVLPTDDAPKA